MPLDWRLGPFQEGRSAGTQVQSETRSAGAPMTSLQGCRLSAGRDVTRAGQATMRSPSGCGQAESPVSSREGAGPERVSEAESKQARDPPFPSGWRASCLRPEPAAPARLRASGDRAPAPGSRGGRGSRDGAARAARLDGRQRSRRPAPSVLGLPNPASRRWEPPSPTRGTWTLARCPIPKTVKAAAKTSAPTAAGTSRKMEPGPWQWRARRARRPGGPWRRRPAAEQRRRAHPAPGARRAPEARGRAPPTPRPPRGLQPRATPRTVSRVRSGERQLPHRRGRRGGGGAQGGAGDAWTMRESGSAHPAPPPRRGCPFPVPTHGGGDRSPAPARCPRRSPVARLGQPAPQTPRGCRVPGRGGAPLGPCPLCSRWQSRVCALDQGGRRKGRKSCSS